MSKSANIGAREKHVRRKAANLGLMLRKSRVDGSWLIIDPNMATIAAGWQYSVGFTGRGWPLEWVEKYLSDASARRTGGPAPATRHVSSRVG